MVECFVIQIRSVELQSRIGSVIKLTTWRPKPEDTPWDKQRTLTEFMQTICTKFKLLLQSFNIRISLVASAHRRYIVLKLVQASQCSWTQALNKDHYKTISPKLQDISWCFTSKRRLQSRDAGVPLAHPTWSDAYVCAWEKSEAEPPTRTCKHIWHKTDLEVKYSGTIDEVLEPET